MAQQAAQPDRDRENDVTELEASQQNIRLGIRKRKKDVKLLQNELEAINGAADDAVKDSEKIFNHLICIIQNITSEVKQQVRTKQKTEVIRVKELQENLEKEIAELKKNEAELEQLSHTEDHNQFLQNDPSLPLSESTHSSSVSIHSLKYFEDVSAAVSKTRDKLQDVLTETWTNLSLTMTDVEVLLPQPDHETRAGFLKYSREITLDPNTVNEFLSLTDGNRTATITPQQRYPDHPDRFTRPRLVMSEQSLTGRCYWEVELCGKDEGVYVAVAYKVNNRDLNWDDTFGFNDKSWAVNCNGDKSTFCHNGVKTPVSAANSRVGVYLDYAAGYLSFYNICEYNETMTLLHRVKTTFTRPLHAAFGFHFWYGAYAKLIKLK